MNSRTTSSRTCPTCKGACRCGHVFKVAKAAASKDDSDIADLNPTTEPNDDVSSNPCSPATARKHTSGSKLKRKTGTALNVAKQKTPCHATARQPGSSGSSMSAVLHGGEIQQIARANLSMEGPQQMHVLQPHTHRRHFEHHLLDHFSSEELLASRSTFRRREIWKELTPVSTTCEYKDVNFLSQGSPPRQPIFAKQHLTTTTLMSDGAAAADAADALASDSFSGWKRAPPISSSRLFNKHETGRTLKSEDSSFQTVVDARSQEKHALFKKDICTRLTGNSRGDSKTKPGVNDRTEQSWAQRLRGKKAGRVLSGTNMTSQTNQNRLISRKSPHDLEGLLQLSPKAGRRRKTLVRSKICHFVDSSTQTILSSFVSGLLNHVSSQTGTTSLMSSAAEDDDSSQTASDSYTTSSADAMSRNDSVSGTLEELSLNQPAERRSSTSFKQELMERSGRVLKKLRRLRVYSHQRKGSKADVLTSTLLLLDDLEEIAVEGFELYDNFDLEENEDRNKLEELKKELQMAKRTCHILTSELRRSEPIENEDNERVSDLEEEIKLCRHVAVSLHWELQSADEKCQKVETVNTKLRSRLAAAETEKSIYEKEARSLRSKVDQLSLHASAVPTDDSAVARVSAIPELQRQIRFAEEECKVVLQRLVESEKQKDSIQDELDRYKSSFGEILLPARSLPSGEWKSKDLKIRIRMAEDQAGLLGRRVMQLEMENENLNKQLEEKDNVHTDHSGKPTSSDMQFLEDEVEALRVALQEAEDVNQTLRGDLAKWKDLSMAREELLLKSRTAAPPCESPLSDRDKTPNDVSQPWSLPGSRAGKLHESQSDLTLSGLNSNDADKCSMQAVRFAQTAIDAATQTVESCRVTDVFQSLFREDDDGPQKPASISKKLAGVLARIREDEVTSVVSQLHDLALATRDLVDQRSSDQSGDQSADRSLDLSNDRSPGVPTLTHHVVIEEPAKNKEMQKMSASTQCGNHHMFVLMECKETQYECCSRLEKVETSPVVKPLDVCQLVVLLYLVYALATSMPFLSLVEFVVFVVLFVVL